MDFRGSATLFVLLLVSACNPRADGPIVTVVAAQTSSCEGCKEIRLDRSGLYGKRVFLGKGSSEGLRTVDITKTGIGPIPEYVTGVESWALIIFLTADADKRLARFVGSVDATQSFAVLVGSELVGIVDGSALRGQISLVDFESRDQAEEAALPLGKTLVVLDFEEAAEAIEAANPGLADRLSRTLEGDRRDEVDSRLEEILLDDSLDDKERSEKYLEELRKTLATDK